MDFRKLSAEAIGTFWLTLGGCGSAVIAAGFPQVGIGLVGVSLAFGLTVVTMAYAIGHVSGCHLNPAVTIGLAAIGSFSWREVPGYIVAQMIGAFAGAVLVWLAYLPHWKVTADPASKLGVFATGPAVRNTTGNFITEVIGTAVLLFGILAIAANAQTLSKPGDVDLSFVFSRGLQPLLVGVLVLGIGLSLGGSTGYAINPARDLAPRLAHALLPIPGKGSSDWAYSWIPVIGPIIGGILGAGAYFFMGF